MKIKSEDLLKLHIPCWEEFPAFELYIDQVIAFINESMVIFQNGEEPLITASMINNYVKNGVIDPPVKKKYNRNHLAKLVVICMGKRMLSIADLNESIAAMSRIFEVSEGYNTLCNEVEYEILSAAKPYEYPAKRVVDAESKEIAVMRALASAVARLLLFDRIIGQRRRLSNIASRMLENKK